MTAAELAQLAHDIKLWARELGFDQVGITDTDLALEEPRLQAWLDAGHHGTMDYMARHGMMRARPHELLPGTLRVLSVRMNYLPFEAGFAATLTDPTLGYISRYALGRDYHKVLRNRLKQLGERIEQRCQTLLPSTQETMGEWRPFVDSAPILERPLAAKAGLGWVGKHSLLLSESAGSFFFLGELLVSLPLPVDAPVEKEQCGKCVACINICPTGAIIAPYVVDGRRCISYLTIENDGPIPEEFRPLMGNRIYGCDDCQLI
ncbi:tRNA epoxyqueuosine(34) reductase QueG, partial [Aeromonas media]|uniref:tRNA epoxyqueuosine(34) reductase QueG n=1 Tax=Aeromonas media TaxID=651 RepID=UPI001F489E7F